MRILVLSSTFPPHIMGGAEVSCLNLTRLLVQRGHEMSVLTMAERYAVLLGSHRSLRVLKMPVRMPTLDLYLYWHDRMHDDPANRWLRSQLIEALS